MRDAVEKLVGYAGAVEFRTGGKGDGLLVARKSRPIHSVGCYFFQRLLPPHNFALNFHCQNPRFFICVWRRQF